jgi:hypothetical protein
MRTSIAIASFLTVGAGAVGATALSNVSMKGSDTLFDVTQNVLANCPNTTTLTYVGTGSGNGESAMKACQQHIAPMSRFINGGTAGAGCTFTGCSGTGSPATAEGLLIGLDGISIVASVKGSDNAARQCNGAAIDCDTTTDPNAGLAFNTTVTWGTCTVATDCVTNTGGATPTTLACNGGVCSYTFNSWKDVLRIVYGGMDNANGNAIARRACNSGLRQAVVSNWSKLFQGACPTCVSPNGTKGVAATYAINCPVDPDKSDGTKCFNMLRHAFRRDDSSGTTDVFVSLLGLPGVTFPTADPFCNSVNAGATDVAVPAGMNQYSPDFQDFDPIRRSCAGTNNSTPTSPASTTINTEQVCEACGDLGLVLPIYPTDYLSNADAFPTAACQPGVNAFAHCPTATLTSGNQSGNGRCPNHDNPVFTNQCLVPVSSTGSVQCLAGRSSKPSTTFSTTPVDGCTPGQADGRVYNLHLTHATSSTANGYWLDLKSPARYIQGAFYRIHSTRNMLDDATTGNTTPVCTKSVATDQIGCLVTASPCSIGYAGVSAGKQPNADPLKLNAFDPTPDCIRKRFLPGASDATAYPLARKLFVNSLIGFENVTGEEANLAACFADTAKVNAALNAWDFITLPGVVTCQEFPEEAATNATPYAGCGNAPPATQACANNPAGIPAAPVCGNNIIEGVEQCDGTSLGACTACKTDCTCQ